jgi:hypothetical protein
VAGTAHLAASHRQPVDPENPFLALERATASMIENSLKAWGDLRDTWTEAMFHGIYANPFLQAACGLLSGDVPSRHAGHDAAREAAVAQMRAGLAPRVEHGDVLDAFVRSMVWVLHAGTRGDERIFATLVRLRDTDALASLRDGKPKITLTQFKEAVRDQAMILRMDEAKAVAALPRLLPADPAKRRLLVDAVAKVVTASGPLAGEAAARLARLEALAREPATA